MARNLTDCQVQSWAENGLFEKEGVPTPTRTLSEKVGRHGAGSMVLDRRAPGFVEVYLSFRRGGGQQRLKLGKFGDPQEQGNGLTYWRKEAESLSMQVRSFPSLAAYKEHQRLNPGGAFEKSFAGHLDEIDRFRRVWLRQNRPESPTQSPTRNPPRMTFIPIDAMLTRSAEMQDEILRLISSRPPHPGDRFETAMVACGVAMEHATALRLLFEQGCPTTAVSIMRIQFEALTRAMWMLYAASDVAIQKLASPLTTESEQAANRLPMVSEMVESIVKHAPAEASAMLAQFKDVTWSAMNSYVHSGIHPLRRHAEGYPLPLVLQILQNSNGLLTMTGMVAAILTGDQRCIEPMRKIQTRFSDCLPELLVPPR
ncbi:TPA: hypothetical protein ACGW3W_002265 [Pseudomonas aeruginosa]